MLLMVESEAQGDALPRVVPRTGSGRHVGRYRVTHEVGKGSMGVVWLGYDPVLDRPVAVKEVRLRGDAQRVRETQERMIREARSLGRLSHPNVVGLHDAGTDEDGDVTYLVMEYIPSPSLGAWIESRNPTSEQIIEVFREAGRGLAAAHDLGIVHRDFKPANVLVAKDRSVKVVDFGLALDRGQNPNKRITKIGTSVGTLNYMSPEVMLGHQADHRSDQYSFCVTLYEALYGRRPVTGLPTKKMREAVIRGRLEPAPHRDDVPDAVREVIMRGLSRMADDRFASMDALLDDLEHLPAADRRAWWLLACCCVVLAVAAVVAAWAL